MQQAPLFLSRRLVDAHSFFECACTSQKVVFFTNMCRRAASRTENLVRTDEIAQRFFKNLSALGMFTAKSNRIQIETDDHGSLPMFMMLKLPRHSVKHRILRSMKDACDAADDGAGEQLAPRRGSFAEPYNPTFKRADD